MSEMYGAVWVPEWSVAAAISSALAEVDEPIIVCDRTVRAASPQARRAGIAVGDSKRNALRLLPDIKVIEHDPIRDERMFMPVLDGLNEHIASMILVRPGLVVFPAGAPVKAAGGYDSLADRIIGSVADRGEECQVGFGCGYLAAVLAVRLGLCLNGEETSRFLMGRPIGDLLFAAPEGKERQEWESCIVTLDALGVKTMGELRAMSIGQVASRFGRIGQLLHRLSAGENYYVRGTGKELDVVVAQRHVDGICNSDQATFLAKELADDLALKLGQRGHVASSLSVVARFDDGKEKQRTWSVDGVAAARDFTDRVRWQISGWLRDGDVLGELVFLELSASDLTVSGARQVPLIGQQQRLPEQAQRAVLKVQSLIGDEGALSVIETGGRVPGQAFRHENWSLSVEQARCEGPWVGRIPDPWPATVFPDPPTIRMRCQCQSLLYVSSDYQCFCTTCQEPLPYAMCLEVPRKERLNSSQAHAICVVGDRSRVVDYAGPWCITGRWWEDGYRRAYMQLVLDNAPPVLVFREGSSWFLEGVYN